MQEGQGSPNRERGYKCYAFFISLLGCRRKQITSVKSFPPSLYKFKKSFLLKFFFLLIIYLF